MESLWLSAFLIALLVLQDVRRGYEQERMRATFEKLVERNLKTAETMMDRLQARSLAELQAVRHPLPMPPAAAAEIVDSDWMEPKFTRPPVGLVADRDSED